MLSIWFIAGPPFDATLWSDSAQRLRDLGLHTKCYSLLRSGTGSLASEAQCLSSAIEATQDDVILVGHGTALPLVLKVAQSGSLRGAVLTNGPIDHPDPFTQSLCTVAKLPSPIGKVLFHPRILLRFLASSVGLRRTVVNPYVMEHDTVVAICGPIFADPEIRHRVQTYLKSIANLQEQHPKTSTPILICWGDEDWINNCNYSSFVQRNEIQTTLKTVSGGRFLHPVERPWEIADIIYDWTRNGPTTT